MKRSCECRSCGSIIYVTDKKCPYCGAVNRAKHQSKTTPVSYEPRNRQQDNPNYSYQPRNKKDDEINWGIFILLLIFFWPAALVYLFVKENNKKK